MSIHHFSMEKRDKAFDRVRIPFVVANVRPCNCRTLCCTPVWPVHGLELCLQVIIYGVIVAVFVSVGALGDASEQRKAVRDSQLP
jgi:hypothetical protein